MKKGHIYFILGIAWSGKGTLIENIRNQQEISLYTPLSYKTREIRPNEVNGRDSFFISKAEFYSSVEKGEFLEYALVHNADYYGTKYEDVIEKWVHQWKYVVKEIDINGLQKLKSEHPEFDSLYSTIFLNIPLAKLPERIEQRGVFMSDDELKRRLVSAEIEEEEISKICDFKTDATLSPQEVLEAFLSFVKQNIS